jgi:hypothetical protein
MLACILFTKETFATDLEATPAPDGKFYVDPNIVCVSSEGIFIKINNNFIPVESVSMDGGGIFIISYKAVRWVECPICHHIYDADRQSSKCPHGLIVNSPLVNN